MLIKRLLHRWVLMNEAGGADGGAGSAGGGAGAAGANGGAAAGSGAAASGSAGGDGAGAAGAGSAAAASDGGAGAGTGAAAAASGEAAGAQGAADTSLNPPASLVGEAKEAPAEGEQGKEGTEAKPAEEAKPIEYTDFTLPEGVEANAEALTAFKEAAAAAKLTQEQAQSFVDLHQKAIDAAAKAPYELWRDTQKQWQDEIKADPEFGGGKLEKETIPSIARAIKAFSPSAEAEAALRQAFHFTGAGNHPEMIRFMARIGKSLQEGSHVSGSPTSGDGGKSAAQKLYPTTGNGQS